MPTAVPDHWMLGWKLSVDFLELDHSEAFCMPNIDASTAFETASTDDKICWRTILGSPWRTTSTTYDGPSLQNVSELS